MGERITIASDDPEFATWLERFVGTVRPYSELHTCAFGAILDATGAVASEHGCDVLLLHASFGSDPDDPGCEGLAQLRRLRPAPDRPVIVAYLLVIVTIFIFINLLVDLLYSVLDPRVRLAEAKG